MARGRQFLAFLLGSMVLVLTAAPASHAGLGDKLKKKVQSKVTQKVENKVDEKADEATGDDAATTESAEGTTAPSSGDEQVSEVSTKFDYVPGDKVLFFDDFTQDELGEFPAQWKLSIGTFEVVEQSGERWLRCTSDDGTVSMKVPEGPLPESWTLEFDFYAKGEMQSALSVSGLGKTARTDWCATWPNGPGLAFRSGDIISQTTFEGGSVEGRHHVMFMARGKALKVYVDRQRLANVPEISHADGAPMELSIRLWSRVHPMITNVRYAEGCKPPKDMLAQGKLVTYGIHFESGSDVVLPDSAPVLRQIAAYMDANKGVKLAITGHTDNVGKTDENRDLSKRRAAAVAKVLVDQFKIAADRFTTDGKGDSEKVADNTTAAGRAMNRRVEFAKA